MIAATIAVVAERGYQKTTVDAVLEAAQTPAAVFAEHFESLADCYFAGVEEASAYVERLVRRRLSSQASWPQRVRCGLRALLSAIAANPDLARATIVESFHAGGAARERYEQTLSRLARLLDGGRACATHPEGLTDEAARALVGGIAAIVHRHAFEGKSAELPLLLDELTDFALMPSFGDGEA